jgi:hypothetical protein
MWSNRHCTSRTLITFEGSHRDCFFVVIFFLDHIDEKTKEEWYQNKTEPVQHNKEKSKIAKESEDLLKKLMR